MKHLLLVAGLIGVGLVTAAPAAASPSSTVSCSPAFLCSVNDFVTEGPKTFVDGIVSGPKRFSDSVNDFVTEGPKRFVDSITKPFAPAEPAERAVSADSTGSTESPE